jgi:hypothetical protein
VRGFGGGAPEQPATQPEARRLLVHTSSQLDANNTDLGRVPAQLVTGAARSGREGSMKKPIQKAFDAAVGKLTKAYNDGRAKEHRQRAAHKRRLAHEQFGHVPYGTGKWDEGRQRGYEQRTERLQQCGTEPRKMAITCQ